MSRLGKRSLKTALMAAFALILTALTAPATATVNAAQASSVTLNPAQGAPGLQITATGTDWSPGDHIQASGWGANLGGIATVLPNNTFSITIDVPPTAALGPEQLLFTDLEAHYFEVATFTVVTGTPPPPPPPPAACSDSYFIGLHGMYEGPDANNPSLSPSSTITETLAVFKAAMPGRTVTQQFVDFPRGAIEDFRTSSLTPINSAERAGEVNLKAAIDSALQACPTQTFVLAGYSLGAWVIDIYLNDSANAYVRTAIRGVILYGDPDWYNTAGGHTYKGLAQQFSAVVPTTPYPYYDVIPQERWGSICLENDAVCGQGFPNALGTDQLAAAVTSCVVLAEAGAGFCEHQKYAQIPDPAKPNETGYGLTTLGGQFLASIA